MADAKTAPNRSLKSFGVAGLLDEQCRVYYQNVFSPQGIGRVSDLVAAKLADAGADELRVRSTLLFGFFDAYRMAMPGATRQALPEPVVIECGIDTESIAFGFSFKLPEGAEFNTEGLEARVRDEKGDFEKLLARMTEQCDRLCVKFAPSGNRIEIDSVIKLGAVSGPAAEVAVEVLVFDSVTDQTPGAGGYVELGDLDYSELVNQGAGPKVGASPAGIVLAGSVEVIGDEVRIGDLRRAAEGETRVAGTPDTQDAEGVRVTGSAEQEASRLVKGSAEVDPGSAKVSGKAERFDEAVTIVKGGGAEGAEAQAGLASGPDGSSAAEKTAELYQRRISQLLDRIQQLEKEKASGGSVKSLKRESGLDVGEFAAPLPSFLKAGGSDKSDGPDGLIGTDADAPVPGQEPASGPDVEPAVDGDAASLELASADPDAPEIVQDAEVGAAAAQSSSAIAEEGSEQPSEEPEVGVKKLFKSLFSKVWPFKKENEDESGSESEGHPEGESNSGDLSIPASDTAEVEDLDYKDVPDAATALKSLMVEIETGGLEQTISGLKKEAVELKSKSSSAQVKKLAEQMLKEISDEKAKLFLMARKLNWAVKKREMEVRNKETALQEELKRRDELIKKKDILVSHTKSQMAHLNMNMERLKSTAQTAVEDQQYKKKYAHLQKLYESAKGESLKHLRELDRVKKQVTSMKFSAAAQQTGAVSGELDELKGKHDRTMRQLDEFKRMNKQLIDRIGHLERQKASATSPPGTSEIRERLDQAMKVANSAKGETEQMQAKVEALEQERERLREMLRKAMDQIKKYVSARKPPSSAA